MKQIPYGLTDFSRIHKDNYYYVDKTMFIEKLEMQPYFLFLNLIWTGWLLYLRIWLSGETGNPCSNL
ncbi:AAA family ATPase [Bacteroides sp.]|uniref:AAA family ATPase n=1 Tax=Bacteroides sp. TaxID=29523 RepID=UPI003457B4FC